jgi:hypothetical protein
MPFTPVTRDALLNGLAGVPITVQAAYASLHSNIPDATGSYELMGGSPAYARKPINFIPSTGGAGRLTKNPLPVVTFDVPSGSVCVFVGLWTHPVGGTFLGYAPIAGDPPLCGTMTSSNDRITSPGHALGSNDRVLVMPFTGVPTPPGLPFGLYYADPVSPNEFKLRSVLGGPFIDASADGILVFQKVRADSFSAQGQLTLSNLVIGMDA